MTIKPKLQRFQTATAFACPICQESLDLVQQSLVCTNRHSFDLAKFGYVNLAPQVKASKDYDKENFQNRQLVLENGFYDHILTSLSECLSPLDHPANILDIGCGEGYYSRSLQERYPDHSFYAFDLSKESIQLAAKSDQEWKVKWFVGDLARLPLLDQSMDLLLDIFSPANYQEFKTGPGPRRSPYQGHPNSHPSARDSSEGEGTTWIRPIIPMSRLFNISLIILRLKTPSIARKPRTHTSIARGSSEHDASPLSRRSSSN